MRRTEANALFQSLRLLFGSASDAFISMSPWVLKQCQLYCDSLFLSKDYLSAAFWRLKGTTKCEFVPGHPLRLSISRVCGRTGPSQKGDILHLLLHITLPFYKNWLSVTLNECRTLTVSVWANLIRLIGREKDPLQKSINKWHSHHYSCCVMGAELWKVNKGVRQLANHLQSDCFT